MNSDRHTSVSQYPPAWVEPSLKKINANADVEIPPLVNTVRNTSAPDRVSLDLANVCAQAGYPAFARLLTYASSPTPDFSIIRPYLIDAQ